MPISIPGRSNSRFSGIPESRFCEQTGFTLIELVVVISLISLLLTFSLPRFSSPPLADENRKVAQWIILKTRSLKEQSKRDKKPYILYVDIDADKFWFSLAAATDEEREQAERNAFILPDGYRVLDTEYPDGEKKTAGKAQIYFSEKGFSSKVLIHIENTHQQQRTFLIESFLTEVKLFETYRGFEG